MLPRRCEPAPPRVAQRLLQIVRDLALLVVELLRALREILERRADGRLPLGRELLQRFLKLTPRLLDRTPRFLGAHLLACWPWPLA